MIKQLRDEKLFFLQFEKKNQYLIRWILESSLILEYAIKHILS